MKKMNGKRRRNGKKMKTMNRTNMDPHMGRFVRTRKMKRNWMMTMKMNGWSWSLMKNVRKTRTMKQCIRIPAC